MKPELKARIIHKIQVPQCVGFNESHSTVENVVVITGKLITLPYGMKVGLNSENHYQQFYFLLLLFCTPPPACLCLSLLLSLPFNLIFSLSSTQFFIDLPLPALESYFKSLLYEPSSSSEK